MLQPLPGGSTPSRFFVDEPALRQNVRAKLKAAPDLTRALSRIALDRGRSRVTLPRCAMEWTLRSRWRKLWLAGRRYLRRAGRGERERQRLRSGADQNAWAKPSRRLCPCNGATAASSRPGFDGALDEFCALRDETRKVIAALQARYCDIAETRQLKLKHNHFLGYFIEVPQAQGERLLKPPHASTFVHRQTMAGAMRFSTKELAELEVKISSAAEEALSREQKIFAELSGLVLRRKHRSNPPPTRSP